jgi:hypothetical protein
MSLGFNARKEPATPDDFVEHRRKPIKWKDTGTCLFVYPEEFFACASCGQVLTLKGLHKHWMEAKWNVKCRGGTQSASFFREPLNQCEQEARLRKPIQWSGDSVCFFVYPTDYFACPFCARVLAPLSLLRHWRETSPSPCPSRFQTETALEGRVEEYEGWVSRPPPPATTTTTTMWRSILGAGDTPGDKLPPTPRRRVRALGAGDSLANL